MVKVLYLGNKFFEYRKVNSVLETLEPLLKDICILKTASKKSNQILRAIDLIFHFFRYGLYSDKIIIDVYSTLAFQFAFVLGVFSYSFRKPYILFLHGGNLPYRYYKSPFKLKWLLNHATQIIAPSQYLAEFFKNEGFNVQVIPNFIALKEYNFIERKKIRPNILSIRGFGKPYNPLMTLKAFHLLKGRLPDLKLLMLGNEDEYYFEDVKNYINDNQLNEVVEVRSKMKKEHWITLSQDYDIMISNPIIDNTPVSILEGMALGLCVISTRVGGVSFIASDNECSMVESNDFIALSDSILKILDNPIYANQLSLNGRKKAEEFNWDNIKPLWENLLLQ
jgi:glycosyltransferase involved in cell wall biosynthesis